MHKNDLRIALNSSTSKFPVFLALLHGIIFLCPKLKTLLMEFSFLPPQFECLPSSLPSLLLYPETTTLFIQSFISFFSEII